MGYLLLLVWLLPGLCHGLSQPLKMQSTQQGCAWGWLGRRRLLKAEDSTAGSSSTRQERQQVSSTIPANPQLPQGCFVQLQIPFLSSWMNSLPKAHWICVDLKPFTTNIDGSWLKWQISPLSLQTLGKTQPVSHKAALPYNLASSDCPPKDTPKPNPTPTKLVSKRRHQSQNSI